MILPLQDLIQSASKIADFLALSAVERQEYLDYQVFILFRLV
jgi:hypothetical protein